MSFFAELKRRNVFRVGIAYVVVAWLALQIADVMIDNIGAPDWVFQTLLLVLAIGLPVTLVVAWAFELTPEGLKLEHEVDRGESIAPRTGRKLDRLIIVFMGLVLAWFLFDEFYLEPRETGSNPPASIGERPAEQEQQAIKTLAVLPFADLSENQDQDWFADGLAEEILNALARAPDILVASRTSAFAYKGTTASVSQIARELGVDHILEGSVRRVGDRIRVTAQLIRAQDGFHVWSENFDRDADDVIAIQEELAISIAGALNTTMDPGALEQMLKAGTRSVEAYEWFLTGSSLNAQAFRTSEYGLLLEAYDAFEKARTVDPDFAAAHALAAEFWLAQMSISKRGSNLTDLSSSALKQRFQERIDRAIDAADTEIERKRYQIKQAIVAFRLREAIRLGLDVLAQRPFDLLVFNDLTDLVLYANDPEASEFLLDQTYALREQGPEWAAMYITTAWRAPNPRPIAEVVEWANRRYNHRDLLYQSHRALLWQGHVEQAREMMPLLLGERKGSREILEARQACAEGRRSEVERMVDLADPDMNPGDSASLMWHLLQMLGRHDEAHALLEPWANGDNPLPVGAYLIYPDFDPSYFPFLQDIMRRENVDRPPPRTITFACPEQDLVKRQSVAVLPFRAMSSGADDEYFADGLTEEILNYLAHLPELLVTARTSSFHFKGQDLPVPDIARQLGVEHVVEGSVRRAGERARITAQLIRAEDGFHLWSETYDRTLEDVFAVQEDIAENIAASLDVVLNDEKRQRMRQAGIGNVDAFINYQKALEAFQDAHSTSEPLAHLPEANRLFDLALQQVPDIPTALYLRTDLYGHQIYDNATGLRPADSALLQAAQSAIQDSLNKAIRAADTPAQRAIFEVERTMLSNDWTGIAGQIDRAFVPGDCTETNWMPTVAGPYGWAQKLVDHGLARRRCDPLNGLNVAMLLMWQLWNGDADAALRSADAFLAAHEFHPWVDDMRFFAQLATGEYRQHPERLTPDPEGSFTLVPRALYMHAMNGEIEQARALYETWRTNQRTDDSSLATIAAALGDRDLANAAAGAIDSRPGGAWVIAETVKNCWCGAPFELDATPNFKARLEEAGMPWPPPSPLRYPAKDW